jgi:hypothetical protein
LSDKEQNETLLAVLDRYKRAVKADQDYLVEVEEARRFYASDQWMVYKSGRWIVPHRPKHRVRLTINKLIPAVESIISSYMQSDPTINADPSKPDDSARKQAEITRKVSSYYWRHMRMKMKLADVILHVCVDGNVWLRSRWDPLSGKHIPRFKDASELGDMAGRPARYGDVEEWVPQGDPVADVLVAGSFFMEPGAADLEDAAWCISIESLKKDEVERRFEKELKGKGLEDEDLNYLEDFNPAFSPYSLAYPSDNDKERVILYTCYERQSRKHKRGRIIYCTNGRLLRTQPLPVGPDGPEIRIVQITGIKLPGEKCGTSVVSQAIPPQAEYNKRRSMTIEDIKLASRPQVLSPIGALDTDEWDNEPGKIIEWDPNLAQGEKPEWMRGPGPSSSMYTDIQVLAEEIDDLLSRHDPSMGIMGGSSSGKHAERAMAADNSRFGISQLSVQEGLSLWGRYLISDIREHMSGERTVMIVGDYDKQDVVTFTNKDMADDCSIEYNIISQLTWSKEQMRQTVMWLYSVGLLDKMQAMEMMKFPIKDYLYESQYRHRVNARKENAMLRDGMQFPPVPGDDHPVHMYEHLQQLAKPEVREEVLAHYAQTMQQAQQRAAAHMQMYGQPEIDPQTGQPVQPSGQWPQWVIATVTHAEQHRKAIPQPAPQPPRQSISLRGEIPPDQAAAIGQRAAAGGSADKPQKGQKPQGMATPPGGMSGENYTEGPGGDGPPGSDTGMVPGGQIH